MPKNGVGGLDKAHFTKVMRKLAHNEREIERVAMEKRRQEKASTKLNISTSLKLDEVGSFDSSYSESLDAEPDTELIQLKILICISFN
ncbi:hypothetical protein AVEN_245546-1 [Araneus ventricosus]|uniref:Uncharacterized protein n=1 Tax=Araneus ventricosus TaxID=182803 RepID=A0A4Y2JVL8_ARAVE|nr:hypothetical protein AVEN_245546-1 [Araneus ventricosus]